MELNSRLNANGNGNGSPLIAQVKDRSSLPSWIDIG